MSNTKIMQWIWKVTSNRQNKKRIVINIAEINIKDKK